MRRFLLLFENHRQFFEVLQQTLEVRFAIGKQGESMSQEIQCEELHPRKLSNDWMENPP